MKKVKINFINWEAIKKIPFKKERLLIVSLGAVLLTTSLSACGKKDTDEILDELTIEDILSDEDVKSTTYYDEFLDENDNLRNKLFMLEKITRMYETISNELGNLEGPISVDSDSEYLEEIRNTEEEDLEELFLQLHEFDTYNWVRTKNSFNAAFKLNYLKNYYEGFLKEQARKNLEECLKSYFKVFVARENGMTVKEALKKYNNYRIQPGLNKSTDFSGTNIDYTAISDEIYSDDMFYLDGEPYESKKGYFTLNDFKKGDAVISEDSGDFYTLLNYLLKIQNNEEFSIEEYKEIIKLFKKVIIEEDMYDISSDRLIKIRKKIELESTGFEKLTEKTEKATKAQTKYYSVNKGTKQNNLFVNNQVRNNRNLSPKIRGLRHHC